MISKNKLMLLLALILCTPAHAGWFTSDGDNYAECMENRRSDIKNQSQLIVARQYCISKHPPQARPPMPDVVYETPQQNDVMSVGVNNPRILEFTNNLQMVNSSVEHDGHDYGSGIKSDDFKYYYNINVTNRNDFPISGLILGIQKKVGACATTESGYSEIYSCDGSVEAKKTGSVKCYIPKIEKRKFSYCSVGFRVYATPSAFKNFMNSR